MHDQVSDYLDSSFNPFLSAFKKGFGCQSTLLRLLEDWHKAFDNHECIASILMGLSKAFDCLPHGLLIAKLKANGLSEEAVKLLDSYLSDRSRQIKLRPYAAHGKSSSKGSPRLHLGTSFIQCFIIGIFYFIV